MKGLKCHSNRVEQNLNKSEFGQLIHSLALSLQILAVKTIIQASGVIALRIAFAIIKVSPALQRGRAVLPRVVEVEGAVALVPAALMVVTVGITDPIVL